MSTINIWEENNRPGNGNNPETKIKFPKMFGRVPGCSKNVFLYKHQQNGGIKITNMFLFQGNVALEKNVLLKVDSLTADVSNILLIRQIFVVQIYFLGLNDYFIRYSAREISKL